MSSDKPLSLYSKIKSLPEVVDFLSVQKNKKVVFTNGCFDILHKGHIHTIFKAADLGDILVLGLNSDASVKRLKGDERPINREEDRAVVMAALEAVDLVVLFDEDTPERLIRAITPNVLVKGGDYTLDQIVGSDFVLESGGAVEVIAFEEGYSTTRLINKMKK